MLDLGTNFLEGTIPVGFDNFTAVQVLNLNNNKLSGTLSANWGLLPSLRMLQLQNNLFTGTLPPSWGQLRSAMKMDLSLNNLYGRVPKEWPEGMRSTSWQMNTLCKVTCRGFIGVNAACSSNGGGGNCRALNLWYNQLDTKLWNLPPANASNLWNWRDATINIGPQRARSTTASSTPSLLILNQRKNTRSATQTISQALPSSSVTVSQTAGVSTKTTSASPSSSAKRTSSMSNIDSPTCE